MQKTKCRVAVAGSTGYSGQELLKLLPRCADFELQKTLGREGFKAADLKGLDLVFLCTPNEISLEWATEIIGAGVSVVDLSGAFRLKKYSYSEWYAFDHSQKELLEKSELGLQPWNKIPSLEERPGPRLIANPGCYATAAQMLLIPLLQSDLIDAGQIFIDAKSGTSGAGRKADVSLIHAELYGEFKPYKVGKHQHWPEIVEGVERHSGKKIQPVFLTELLPIERGISLAAFLDWSDSCPQSQRKAQSLLDLYQEAYSKSDGVQIGVDDSFSSLKSVQHSNRISIRVCEAYNKPVVFAVIDNLQRGAAGQALLNAHALWGVEVPEFLR